ncbi:MAG: hypothetical protein CM15mP32_4010 [Flavobacteriaceae bacterium]|nr:MAG: hypothetical protein CM15mP32_4010 [Flavobacteriaceae bacterium]
MLGFGFLLVIVLYNLSGSKSKWNTPMALHYHKPMVVTDVGGLSEGLKMPVAKLLPLLLAILPMVLQMF